MRSRSDEIKSLKEFCYGRSRMRFEILVLIGVAPWFGWRSLLRLSTVPADFGLLFR